MVSRRDFLAGIAAFSTSACLTTPAIAGDRPPKTEGVEDPPINVGRLKVPHQRNRAAGQYSLYAYAFAAGKLQLGRDYDAMWNVPLTTVQKDVQLDWYVPGGPVPEGFGVWGYHHLDYQVPRATMLKDINVFKVLFDWAFSGSSHFNLLAECWLGRTQAPPAWNHTEALWEIGFFLHAADYDFHNGGVAIGAGHLNEGVRYSCRRNDRYITFAPLRETDVLTGKIDWKSAFEYLMAERVLSGTEWISGKVCLLGIEPTGAPRNGKNSGLWTVNSVSAQFT